MIDCERPTQCGCLRCSSGHNEFEVIGVLTVSFRGLGLLLCFVTLLGRVTRGRAVCPAFPKANKVASLASLPALRGSVRPVARRPPTFSVGRGLSGAPLARPRDPGCVEGPGAAGGRGPVASPTGACDTVGQLGARKVTADPETVHTLAKHHLWTGKHCVTTTCQPLTSYLLTYQINEPSSCTTKVKG